MKFPSIAELRIAQEQLLASNAFRPAPRDSVTDLVLARIDELGSGAWTQASFAQLILNAWNGELGHDAEQQVAFEIALDTPALEHVTTSQVQRALGEIEARGCRLGPMSMSNTTVSVSAKGPLHKVPGGARFLAMIEDPKLFAGDEVAEGALLALGERVREAVRQSIEEHADTTWKNDLANGRPPKLVDLGASLDVPFKDLRDPAQAWACFELRRRLVTGRAQVLPAPDRAKVLHVSIRFPGEEPPPEKPIPEKPILKSRRALGKV